MKCLIFDSDGTLVDSELLNCAAMAEALQRYGVKERAQDLLQRYRGWGLRYVIEDIQRLHGVVLDNQFLPHFRQLAAQHFKRALQPIAGVEAALQGMSQPRCVASNGPMEKLRLALSITGLDKYFHGHVYSAYDVGSFKPDPGLFLFAAAQMGFAPSDCVVIEDSLVGLESAAAAGMQSLFYNPLQLPLVVPQGTRVIQQMAELPAIIGG